MAFGRYPVAGLEPADFTAAFDNLATEFVPGGQRDRDRVPGPFVPLIDVYVGAADRGLVDLDQDVVVADSRNIDVLHPDAALRLRFH